MPCSVPAWLVDEQEGVDPSTFAPLQFPPHAQPVSSQDILAVMTDRLHKSGFKMHATLLRHMFQLVETGQVALELYDPAQNPNITVRP